MEIKTLEEMTLNVLKATYYAEQEIAKALPKMAEAAASSELRQAFTQHLRETQTQVQRLERVFQSFGEEADTKTCDIIDAMIKTCEKMIKNTEQGSVRDAGLIFFAQGVEHYEICHYGTLIAWSRACGQEAAVSELEQTLKEEKNTDSILNRIAHGNINSQAAGLAKAA